MVEKLDPDLLKRLDAVIEDLNNAIEKLNPNGDLAHLLFEPTQELGWAVDEMMGRHTPISSSS